MPFMVSASALPIVQAAGPLAGFSRERCRGIEVQVREGKFTAALVQPIPYAGGKVEAARRAGRLALACGDSFTGDLPMLEAAQVAVVVAPAKGSPLSAEALKRGWPVLSQET
jgi:phosphoserine phosphatase